VSNHEPDAITPPPEQAEPSTTADELVSHGLLTFLHRDPPAETERRIRGVMQRIADETPVHAGGRAGPMAFAHARRWIALAACFVIAAGLVYLGLPTSSSAQAMVQASAAALRTPGDRRFEIRVQPRGSKELTEAPIGTIDTHNGELMVLRMQPEEGLWITFGRDPQGPWLVYPDGRMERNPPVVAMPRFAVVNDEPVLPDSVDHLLDELAFSYNLEKTSEKSADGASMVEHIVGLRRADRKPGPTRIEVWIDPATKGVKKLELFFPEPPLPPRGMGGPPGGRGPGGPGGEGPDGPDGPRGDRGRRPPLDGPREGEGRDDGPPPDGGREGRRGRRDGRGPDDFDGRGPGGPGMIGARGQRGGPTRVELRPAMPPQPPLPPEWFTPEHHAKKTPAPRP
jgi:hypothetical protein